MFKRDVILWRLTIKYPGNIERGNILKRLFTILKFGGFFFKHEKDSKEYRWYHDLGLPIACAISHGIIKLN
jgi:hypothetical protein